MSCYDERRANDSVLILSAESQNLVLLLHVNVL